MNNGCSTCPRRARFLRYRCRQSAHGGRERGGNVTDMSMQDRASGQKEPGWYPDAVAPNVQKYWDGTGWIAQRRWLAGQWVSEPVPGTPTLPGAAAGAAAAAAAGAGGTAGAYPGFGSRPYARPPGGRSQTTSTVTFGTIGLLISSVMLIVGSLTPWITVSFAGLSISASGTDSGISSLIGVNGWITFSGGILLLVFVCMAVISADAVFRGLALVVVLVVTGFAAYDLVRIVQKISQVSPGRSTFNGAPINALQANASVGWGLIVVAIGALRGPRVRRRGGPELLASHGDQPADTPTRHHVLCAPGGTSAS